MSQAPYPSGGQSPWSAGPLEPTPQSGSGKTILIVLAVLAAGIFSLLVLLGGLAYYGLQQAVQPDIQVVLPERSDRGRSDAKALAASLQQRAAPSHPEADAIRTWLAARVERAQRGESIAPRPELFHAAVLGSPDGAKMNLIEQFNLQVSLEIGTPEPFTSANYTLVGISPESAPETTRIDILFYDPESLATLHSWFIVKTDGEWELYDWFEAEVGRRASDEYGNYYCQMFDDRADGFDQAEQLVVDAEEAIVAGDTTTARALLSRAEGTPMLPYDRDRALLSIGRAYQTLDGADDRSEQVFEKATRPDEVPGILASLGVTQTGLEKPEEALRTADRLRQLYPTHPTADLVSGYALELLGRGPEAAEHYLRCLAWCPDDTTVYSWLLAQAEPRQAKDILGALQRSEQHREDFFLQWLEYAADDAEMLAAIESALANNDAAPASWQVLSGAALQHARGETSAAVEQLARVSFDSDSGETLRERRDEWLIQWSLESGDLTELSQRPDFPQLMETTAEEIYYEDLYPDTKRLETAFAALPVEHAELRSVAAIRGWAAWQEDRFEDAVSHFSRWLDSSAEPVSPAASLEFQTATDDSTEGGDLTVSGAAESGREIDEEAASGEEGEESLRDEIRWYLNDSLLSLDRFEEAWTRFADDRALAWHAIGRLFRSRDTERVQKLREWLGPRDGAAAEMARPALDATLATCRGAAEEADRSWVACLACFGTPEPETYSNAAMAFDNAARLRGQTAVQLGYLEPVLTNRNAPGWEATVQGICAEVAELVDAKMAATVTAALLDSADAPALASNSPVPDAVREMNATIAETRHDWSTAASIRQQLLDAAEPDQWDIENQRRAVLGASLHAEADLAQLEGSELLRELEDESTWATYYAARGLAAPLRESLSKLDSRERGYWYASLLNRPYVLHDPELADWLSQSDAPLTIAYTPSAGSMLLVEDAPATLSANRLRAAVEVLFGSSAEVEQITAGLPPEVDSRWAVRQPGDFDIVVSAGRGGLDSGGAVPAPLSQVIAESPQNYIAISVLHSDRPLYQISLPLAARLASPSTQMVYDNRSGRAWYPSEEPWGERLKWRERLPTDAHSADLNYLVLTAPSSPAPEASEPNVDADDEGGSADSSAPRPGELVELEWLRKRLSKTGDGCPVLIQLSAEYASEQIPAVATTIDQASSLVELELRAESAVLPSLRSGHRLRADTYQLLHP